MHNIVTSQEILFFTILSRHVSLVETFGREKKGFSCLCDVFELEILFVERKREVELKCRARLALDISNGNSLSLMCWCQKKSVHDDWNLIGNIRLEYKMPRLKSYVEISREKIECLITMKAIR